MGIWRQSFYDEGKNLSKQFWGVWFARTKVMWMTFLIGVLAAILIYLIALPVRG